MSKGRLDDSLHAYYAVCRMLEFTFLSEQSERQILNLKRLLELEISALESENLDDDGVDIAAD